MRPRFPQPSSHVTARRPPFALKKAAERVSSLGSETQQAWSWACPRLQCRAGLGRASGGHAGRGRCTPLAASRWGRAPRLGGRYLGALAPASASSPLPPQPSRAGAATVRAPAPAQTQPGWPLPWSLGAQPCTCGSARLHATGSRKGGGSSGIGLRGWQTGGKGRLWWAPLIPETLAPFLSVASCT